MVKYRHQNEEFSKERDIYDIDNLDEMIESGEISAEEAGFILGCLEEET